MLVARFHGMMEHYLRILLSRARAWLTLGGRISVLQPMALCLAPLLLLLALLLPYRWLYFLVFCYGLVALLAYLWVRWQGPRVQIRRVLRSDWAMVGDELQEQWELHNANFLPLIWLELNDASALPGYNARRVTGCNSHETQRWITSAICTRRGVYALGPLHLRLGEPFGLFAYRWSEAATRRIVVYPPLLRLPALQLPRGQQGGPARADLLQPFATPSVGGLREYRPGDMPSHIHWPTVARTGSLMVKEFDQERAGAIWIMLDLCQAAYPPPLRATTPQSAPASHNDDPLELAVVLAASLAAHALSAGRAVGFCANDGTERSTLPGQGPRQLWQIMDQLVDVQGNGQLPLDALIRRWQQQRGYHAAQSRALVLITPDSSSAWLSTLLATMPRGSTLALLLDNTSFQDHPARPAPMEGLRLLLATQGIAAQIFGRDSALPLLNPPRQRSELRVTPLGRAQRITRD